MLVLTASLLLILGYLSGSVNYAILITRLATGRDIRTIGNRNPGTANVGRSIGRGWAAVVFFLDLGKGLGPMILARQLFVPQQPSLQIFLVAAVGMAAITGHCKPLFFRFRGGGGLATSIGVYGYFIPGELLLCLILGFLIARFFLRSVRYRVGQGVPVLFVSIAPFITLALNFVVQRPLFAGRSLGGHPWYILTVVFALSLFIAGMNFSFVRELLHKRDAGNNSGGA